MVHAILIAVFPIGIAFTLIMPQIDFLIAAAPSIQGKNLSPLKSGTSGEDRLFATILPMPLEYPASGLRVPLISIQVNGKVIAVQTLRGLLHLGVRLTVIQ